MRCSPHGPRVVSMQTTDIFDAQAVDYRQAVLPADVGAGLAVEAGHVDLGSRYVGREGRVIGMQTFGESGPADDLFQYIGVTIDGVVAQAEQLLDAAVD
ncbi:transketolase-like TK C-terminal-containing protein [Halomonas sp. V046]|uniref:transketolase-like TK C-terminal-containing protein n=1 Tax=Halomonas sp. V046 TaxID=3459611 RepID=UPI004044F5AF